MRIKRRKRAVEEVLWNCCAIVEVAAGDGNEGEDKDSNELSNVLLRQASASQLPLYQLSMNCGFCPLQLLSLLQLFRNSCFQSELPFIANGLGFLNEQSTGTQTGLQTELI